MELLPTVRTEEDVAEALSVVVIQAEAVRTYTIPEQGSLLIGRADESDIQVDDPQASREHARLHVVAGGLEVEDLGSANGTMCRRGRLEVGRRVPVTAGDVIEVGETMIVLQRARARAIERRLWSHAFLEARLQEECVRNKDGPRSPFVLMRVRVAKALGQSELEAALTAPLGSTDLIAAYAPGEYELLLLDTARSRAEHVADEIGRALDRRVELGIACFPEDGLTPEALIGAAHRELQGPAGDTDRQAEVIEEPAMKELYRVIDRVARGRISVLLLGETGVGKEVIAEAVHRRSARSAGPFVRLNCAALSEALVESELFGYVEGAFTGADRDREGLLEAAHGGTLFLDEVGELPASTQAKLLRVLELRQVRRVGSVEPIDVDVRFVAATNKNLEAGVQQGTFREDLFYRLNGVSLHVPPLRERILEIPPLVELFARRAAHDLGLPAPKMSAEVLVRLTDYGWPGNIRELKNVIERATLLADGGPIEAQHLPLDKLATQWCAPVPSPRKQGDEEKRQRVVSALEQCAGNQTRAAQILGVSRQTLSKWLDRYDIPRPRKL